MKYCFSLVVFFLLAPHVSLTQTTYEDIMFYKKLGVKQVKTGSSQVIDLEYYPDSILATFNKKEVWKLFLNSSGKADSTHWYKKSKTLILERWSYHFYDSLNRVIRKEHRAAKSRNYKYNNYYKYNSKGQLDSFIIESLSLVSDSIPKSFKDSSRRYSFHVLTYDSLGTLIALNEDMGHEKIKKIYKSDPKGRKSEYFEYPRIPASTPDYFSPRRHYYQKTYYEVV